MPLVMPARQPRRRQLSGRPHASARHSVAERRSAAARSLTCWVEYASRTASPRGRPRRVRAPAGRRAPGQHRGATTRLRTSSAGSSLRPPGPGQRLARRGRPRAAPWRRRPAPAGARTAATARRRHVATRRSSPSAVAVSPGGAAAPRPAAPAARPAPALEHVVRLDRGEHARARRPRPRRRRRGPGATKPRIVPAIPISSGCPVRSPYRSASVSRSTACVRLAQAAGDHARGRPAPSPRPQSSATAAKSRYARRASRSASARSPSSAAANASTARSVPTAHASPTRSPNGRKIRGQPPRLGEPAGEQPGERGGAAQPGPPDRVAQLGEEPGRPAEHRVGAGEVAAGGGHPGQVLQRPRLAAPVAGGRASTWYAAANRLLASAEPAGAGSRPCRAGASPRPARPASSASVATSSASCQVAYARAGVAQRLGAPARRAAAPRPGTPARRRRSRRSSRAYASASSARPELQQRAGVHQPVGQRQACRRPARRRARRTRRPAPARRWPSARRASRPSAATPSGRHRAGRRVGAQAAPRRPAPPRARRVGDERVPLVRSGSAGRRRYRRRCTLRRGPAGQVGVPLGQVGLADAGVRGLAHQRRG